MKIIKNIALPQVQVVACIDDGTTTWWCSYHPTLPSSSPVCLRLPTTLTNSSVWCWLVLLGGGIPSFHDLSLKSLQKISSSFDAAVKRNHFSITNIGDVYSRIFEEKMTVLLLLNCCYYYIFYETHYAGKYYDGDKLHNKLMVVPHWFKSHTSLGPVWSDW